MVDLEGVNSLEWQLERDAWLKVSAGFDWTIRCCSWAWLFLSILFILLLSGIGIFLSRVIVAFCLNLL